MGASGGSELGAEAPSGGGALLVVGMDFAMAKNS